MFDSLKGLGLKARLMNPVDEFWDRRLGVRTFGFRPAVGEHDQHDWRAHYVPTPYKKVLHALRHVGIGPDDVFVDLGCGLGRTVFAASWLGARRAVGVEIDPALARAAQANHRSSRLADRQVEFVCTPAEAYALEDTSVLFMFHPFGEGTMQGVMRQLEAAMARRPRRLRVVYENPVHAGVLDACRALKPLGTWPAGQRGSGYAVNFWQTAGA